MFRDPLIRSDISMRHLACQEKHFRGLKGETTVFHKKEAKIREKSENKQYFLNDNLVSSYVGSHTFSSVVGHNK